MMVVWKVRKCVVIAREDTPGVKLLVAYVVREHKDEQEAVAASMLKQHLAEHLAEYMVPPIYMFMDILPMTPSGKLDRKPKSLPVPDRDRHDLGKELLLPRSQTEAVVSKMFCEVTRHLYLAATAHPRRNAGPWFEADQHSR